MKLKQNIVATALAFSMFASTAQAQSSGTYSALYGFGDSFSDTGNLGIWTNGTKKVAISNIATALGLTIAPAYGSPTAVFTRTPNATGTNFAVGGATGADNSIYTAPYTVPGIETQVNNFLTRGGGKADPKALYVLDIGGNNVNAIVLAMQSGQLTQAQGEAAAKAVAVNMSNAVATLKAAGAKSIVVINVFDLTNIPNVLGLPASVRPTAQAGVQFLASVMNATEKALLAGQNVLLLDIYGFTGAMLPQAAALGFTNTTTPLCSDAGTCTAPTNGALFADGLHPSEGLHSLYSDWILGVLRATSDGAGISNMAAAIPLGRSGAEWRTVDSRMRSFQNASYKGGRMFIAGDYADARSNAPNGNKAADGDTKTLTLGYESAFSDATLVGGTFGRERADFDLVRKAGRLKYDETMLTLYFTHKLDSNWYVNGLASHGVLSYDSLRNAVLGPLTTVETATFGGRHDGIKFQLGYQMRSGDFVHGPFVGADWEGARIKGFSEGNSTTAISVGSQSIQQAHARIGYELAATGTAFRPYVQVSYDDQFLKGERTFFAGMAASGTAMPITTENKTGGFGRLALGASTQVGGSGSELSVGVSSTFSNPAGRDAAINLVWSAPL